MIRARIHQLAETQHVALLLSAAAAAVLAAALFFQHVLGYNPCALCYWQRGPYYAALALFLPPLLFGRRAIVPVLAVAALLFFADAAIAGYHVGVEQGWWAGPATCSASGLPDDPAAALDQILAAPVVRCDEIPWSFLGLSMAGWNMLIALALGAFSVYAIGRQREGDHGQ
ncbi:MAG: disulfide bond formation protein B [Rhodothalassiaceae bacterium]